MVPRASNLGLASTTWNRSESRRPNPCRGPGAGRDPSGTGSRWRPRSGDRRHEAGHHAGPAVHCPHVEGTDSAQLDVFGRAVGRNDVPPRLICPPCLHVEATSADGVAGELGLAKEAVEIDQPDRGHEVPSSRPAIEGVGDPPRPERKVEVSGGNITEYGVAAKDG